MPLTSMRLVWDASALVAVVNVNDVHHQEAYSVWQRHENDVSIFPALAWFEYQAVVSRLRREGKSIQRNLHLLDHKNIVLPIDQDFVEKCAAMKLADMFSSLRGADLVYACMAASEGAFLVTFDKALRQTAGLSVLPQA